MKRGETGTLVGKSYTEGLIRAGAIPLIIPSTEVPIDEQWLSGFDGILLTGGEDVCSLLYGQSPHQKQGRISPDRDSLEMALIPMAIKQGLPILAICRGLQILNVACGGSLLQDINSQVSKAIKHQQHAPRGYGSHQIEIEPDSHLYQIFGTRIVQVNSYHHQAIDQLADGFRVTAWAEDGVIEAIESINQPFVVAVQWHPEGMWDQNQQQYSLVESFVQACKR